MAIRIYTRSGDKGLTRIHGGERVEKDNIRIEANGCLDELNSVIGIIRSMLTPQHEWQTPLKTIQMALMVTMSHVATPSSKRSINPNKLDEEMDIFCEQQIDYYCSQLEDNGFFILPGGSPVSAQCQFARTVARRAERRLWTLNREDPVAESILRFVNRLSDLLFVMARYDMQKHCADEEKWQAFSYKKKK